MKKYLFIVLAIVVICSLIFSGCTKEETTPTQPAPTTEKPAPSSESPTPTKETVAPEKPAPSPSPTTTEGPRYGGKLIFITNQPITGIGAPSDGIFFGARNVVPVFEQLLFRDEAGNIVGGPLAPDYDVTADGLAITLYLREGIEFTDGTPFNAEAVKYNLERAVANKVQGSADLMSIASYDITDDYTIRLNLSKFNSDLLAGLAGPQIGQIASPTALKKETTPETMAQDHTIGTGPFMFDAFERDSYVRYKKNPNYWQEGKPYLDAIEIRTNPDLTVTLMAFRSGEAQWIENIDPIDALTLQEEGYFTDIARGLSFIHGMIPDAGNPDSPLSDIRVREAIEYALDKETMMEGVGMGYYRAPYQMAMPEYPGYASDLPERRYDPEKARALLAEAGYPNGLTLPVTTDIAMRKDILTAIQQYLKEVGIETELDIADMARMAAIKAETGWDGLLIDGMPSISNEISSWRGFGHPYNAIDMIHPDDWIERWDTMVSTVDADARNEQWSELVRIIYNDVSMIPYECDSPLYALDNSVQDLGWCKNGVGNFFDCVNVWLSE